MNETATEERQLVERLLAGDEEAMEVFGDRYFPGLYRFALRLLRGNGEMARDIVQTTACKALAKLSSYRGEASLFTWLCSCCRNEVAMMIRKNHRFPMTELDEQRMEPEAPGQIEALTRSETQVRVHATLDQLPDHYARALEWKYVESLPVTEIARRLDVGAKAAESLLTRARQAFRDGYDHLIGEPAVSARTELRS